MTVLSQELCLCPTGCAGMDVINDQRPYVFNYVSQVLTNTQQYEWMGYISFPYNIIYLSSNSLSINCASSFLYSQNVFYQWTQLNNNLCVYNSSYQNMFVALRQISANQELTIFFDETKRRNLCGVCGCDITCEQTVAIVVGIIAGLIILLGFIICVRSKAIKNIFNVGKKFSLKPFTNNNDKKL